MPERPEPIADERERQIAAGRALAARDAVGAPPPQPSEEDLLPLSRWVLATARAITAQPEKVSILETRGPRPNMLLVEIAPGTSENTAQILGRKDPVTGWSTINAIRQIATKMGYFAGLTVEVQVLAERRP